MKKKYIKKEELNKRNAIAQQDEREAEFSRKHRSIAWQMIEDFYYWLNYDPTENTWLCFKKVLKGRGFSFKVVKDFFDTFVNPKDKPENVSIFKSVS